MYHLFIQSSADGHLGDFNVLAIVKQCYSEYWGTRILSDHVFLWIYAQEWDCRITGEFYV